MKVEINGNQCKVIREPGDPKFRDGTWGSGESRLLYHVKRILNRAGFNLIKKRMWKDGNMVDDRQQYLRSKGDKSCMCIYNPSWQIAGADVAFNQDGEVTLRIHNLTE